jgi:RNA polymerase sigma-70 factor, ECF subfamily
VNGESRSVTDEELAWQTQAGSFTAFEELVSRYEGRIYAFVWNSCRSATTAREVTQDTFVRAFQAIARFDASQRFGPWLFTIARRKCMDHHRAAPGVAGELVPEPLDTDDPAELLARQEERRDLWQLARRHLRPAEFEALWLRYAEDLSIAEISRVQGRTQTHIKVLLFRARRALGRQLEQRRAAELASENHQLKPLPPPATLKPAGLSAV